MNDSPFISLINFKHQSIIVLLCFFNLKQFESLQDQSNEEDRCYNWDNEEYVREEKSNFSDWWWVIFILDLHDWEESEVEIDQHEISEIGIEFELTESWANKLAKSWVTFATERQKQDCDIC